MKTFTINTMKKLLLLTLIVSSCTIKTGQNTINDNTVSQPIKIKELGTSTQQYDRYYQIYTLEGCEYIVVSPGNQHFTWGTHKGNCKNTIHYKSNTK